MNNIQIFNNPEFGQVRMIMVGNKPYAVGVDVARALEYANPSKAVIQHCKGITKLGIPSEGGEQQTNIIPEGDIYRLIVKAADQSKNSKIKARAEKFESWIFDEVLPQIRKTGQYSLQPQSIEDLIILQAKSVKELKQQVNQQQEQITATQESVQGMRDVIKLDTTSWRKDTTSLINKIARALGGYENIRQIRTESYDLLNKRMGVSLQTRLTNKRRRMADEGVCKSRRDRLSHLDIIADDKKLIEGYAAIVKEMAIKYEVA